jgi:hypothetical protein
MDARVTWMRFAAVAPRVGFFAPVAIVGACCSSCAHGKTCETKCPRQANVGRSQPNSEITDHEAAVVQLKADVAAHEPAQGDTIELSNWAKLNHTINGYVLRWGQWKTALASDWWWGDEDEQAFAALKAEYNKLREQFLEYTTGKTEAPKADTTSKVLVQQEQEEAEAGTPAQQLVDTLKILLVVGAVGAVLYFAGPALLASALRRGTEAAAA